jgi:3D (Asp-Asp-Asp) domain-containing protein
MRAKWGKAQEGMIEALEEENLKLKGKPYSVSKYSRLDSCHNRQGDKCLTAGGNDVKEGWTVACPRSIALGTVVNIEGIGERVCDDRTAQWVEDKFGGTFDVFTEDYDEAVQFGRKMRNVVIQ